jgi:signal transduction histidine kinase
VRRHAEAELLARSNGQHRVRATREVLVLLHELQVHQIELELQNEALRQARDEAEAAAARYLELYDFAPVGYATLDADGAILELNLAAADLLGAPRAELVRRRLSDWVPRPAQPSLWHLLAAAQRDGRACGDLELAPAGQGGARFAHLDAAAEAPDRPEGWRCRVALTDVTEQKAAAQLREADRRKGEFLAMLSHELRNPLTPISNAIQLLERSQAGGEPARRATAILRHQTSHLARLVDDLLDLTRISHGKVGLRLEVLDLCDAARRAHQDHRETFEQRGLALRLELPSEPVHVHADATRLGQVLGNLLQNAAKFTPPPGAALLAVERGPGAAVLRVRDDGMGMEPAQLERLFQPFAQAEEDLARTRGGLGLGLALVRGLVELHGGTVTGRSEGAGRGAEFVVTLPLALPPEERPAARAPEVPPCSVVVIEDNQDAASTLAELLELEGHRVEVALDGRAGVALVKRVRPDVVLCDLGLPGLDGYAVAAALRADGTLEATRLVALSGYACPEDLAHSRAAGFDAHLAKPPDLDRLTAQLRPRR